MGKRIEYIDLMKSFAIFCVILGHTLQYGYNYRGNCFYNNRFWAFIYSFHMPLFMMLSGFFATTSLKYDLGVMIKNKIIHIFLPAYLWLAIVLVACLIICYLTGWNVCTIFDWFPSFYDIFWYLNCLFFCYLIFYISIKLLISDILACTLSCILFILSPIGYVDNLNFMLPYFWLGYFLHKYENWIMRHTKSILLISSFNFIILLFFWHGRYTVYKYPILFFPLPSVKYLAVLLYRYAIGIFGSLFFWSFTIFQMTRKKKDYNTNLSFLGQHTLVIYIVNILCCEFYSRSPLQIYVYNGNYINYCFIAILETLLFIFSTTIIIFLLQRNTLTRKYLLGKF